MKQIQCFLMAICIAFLSCNKQNVNVLSPSLEEKYVIEKDSNTISIHYKKGNADVVDTYVRLRGDFYSKSDSSLFMTIKGDTTYLDTRDKLLLYKVVIKKEKKGLYSFSYYRVGSWGYDDYKLMVRYYYNENYDIIKVVKPYDVEYE